VSEAVVALPTAADATALFGRFSQQWEKCQGQTVTTEPGFVVFSDKVTDVHIADSVLSAPFSTKCECLACHRPQVR
jgi:hypothetical protein